MRSGPRSHYRIRRARPDFWLPLVQTAAGYQSAIGIDWQSNGHAELINDPTYGAQILRSTWARARPRNTLKSVSRRSLRPKRATDGANQPSRTAISGGPNGERPDRWYRAHSVEHIVAGRTDPRERLRAIYDWVVDTTWRNPDTPGCGLVDIKAMLEFGNFGGKCVDINGLMVGLARAAGIPARDVYGVRVADSRLYPSLGKSGDISKAQHCRAEAYLEDAGWFPIDPADVRKVVLEQKLAVDSAEVHELRERLFGNWKMNWVVQRCHRH